MSKEQLSPKPTSSKDSTALNPDNLASSSNASSETVCGVCGEKTESKHYGAYSCLSCKVFFRRSIAGSRIYFCEGNGDCVIEKEQRVECKACRLAKCLKIGMKPKMLQSSRKGPSKKQKKPPSSEISLLHNPCVDRSQVDALVLFDRHLFNRVDPPTEAVKWNMTTDVIELPFLTAFRQPSLVHRRTKMLSSVHRIATANDLFDDMHRKFVLYADWLNEFRDFQMLPEHVQVVLAKNGCTQYSLNVYAWRTVHIDCPGVCFANGSFFPIDRQLQCAPDPKGTVPLLMHNIVDVMKSLKVDETEYILLKIIHFFTEDSQDLTEAERDLVREKRDKYIAILMRYIQSKRPRLVEVDAACRVGELMLLLASLTNIAHLSNDTVNYWDTLRIFRVGELMCEIYKNPSGPSLSDVPNLSTSQVSSE